MSVDAPESHAGTDLPKEAAVADRKPTRLGRPLLLVAVTGVAAGAIGAAVGANNNGAPAPGSPGNEPGNNTGGQEHPGESRANLGPDYVCREIAPQIQSDLARIVGDALGPCIVNQVGSPAGIWFGSGGNTSVDVVVSNAYLEGTDVQQYLRDLIAAGDPGQIAAWNPHVPVAGRDAMCSRVSGAVNIRSGNDIVSIGMHRNGQPVIDPQNGCSPEVLAIGEALVAKGLA